ncbi:unnamed protein product [Rhizophagus irregularis]|nr:unnamed protein product [Rhizophagus irregularis]
MIDEVKDNPETRTSIDYEQEVIVVKSCVKDVDNTFNETITSYENARSIKSKKISSRNIISSGSGITLYEKKKDYQIEICQDGKFVATFDTANLRIRILKNTDRRPLKNNDHNESDEINETIVHFEIKDDFTICKFFNEGNDEVNNQEEDEIINFNNNAIDSSNSDEYNETRLSDRWSFDISNVCRKNDNKYFIFVAVSNIDDEDMKSKTEGRKKRKGTTTVYRVELKIDKGNYVFNKDTKTIVYHIYGVSGLCRFVEVSKNNENTEVSNLKSENKYFALRRFIILNFDGIHSFNCKDDFNFYKKLNYPKRVRDELDLSKTFDCMNPLRSCIYDKYFLVEHYKDSVQLLEVYDLAKMKLETITKRIENSHYKFARKYNRNNFSISENKLHLCFTRGLQSVKMYFMENGLEAISKKFDEIEKIHLIEFIERDRKLLVIGNSASEEKKLKLIIWNMYNVGEIETMMELDDFLTIDNLGTRLARTSGNLLQVDNEGNVKSILKRLDKLLKQQQETEDNKGLSDLDIKRLKVIEPNERIIVHYNENINPNFKPTFIMKEPWKTINDDTEKYEITNVMELAIYHCKGREIKDTIIVAYLLEYYTRHAIDYVDDYVKKLFRKECFVNQNYFPAKDHYNIIPEEYQKRRGMKFRAFEVNLYSNKIKWYNVVWKLLKSYRNKTYKFFGDIDNNDIENHPLALRVVPLPEFTVNCAPQQDKSKEKIFLNILLFLFIPRCVEKADTGLIVLIASSVFFLWIEGISYLRLIPNIAIYIYYVIIITKTVFPFILFNGIAIIAFAHTMFILLKETKNIKIKDSTFSGTATNPLNGQELNVSMKANFDPTDRNDNPFSYFPTAMVATFYWLSGDYVQRDAFDSWAVEVFTLIASILLVIILQNMLIAFMGGVYEKAATKGRQALLRFRANQIANYEALYPIHFPPIERDPKYIYYVGQSKTFETWYEDRKDDCAIFKDFEKKSTFEEFVFNEKNYDKFSIWDYDVDIESEIEKFKTMKNSLNDNIEKMIKNLEDRKNNDNSNDIDIDEKVKMLKAIKN